MEYTLPKEYWGKKAFPKRDQDQGDPCCVRVDLPDGKRKWITIHSGENAEGCVFAYESDDFKTWRYLGTMLDSTPERSHWAPWLGYFPALAETGSDPWVIIVSRGEGQGRQAHVGHKLELWTSPDIFSRKFALKSVLTPDTDFCIDADVFMHPITKKLMIARAENFYDEPVGTGVVIAPLSDDLTAIGPDIANIRAVHRWQTYERDRTFYPSDKLDLPDRFKVPGKDEWFVPEWFCVEGWSGGYVIRSGKYAGKHAGFYSSGRYQTLEGYEYGVGVAIETEPGTYLDVTTESINTGKPHYMIRTNLEHGILDPGHGTYVLGPEDAPYYCVHLRDPEEREFDENGVMTREAERQAAFFPIVETDEGLPYCMLP